jgi:hypothetical protein
MVKEQRRFLGNGDKTPHYISSHRILSLDPSIFLLRKAHSLQQNKEQSTPINQQYQTNSNPTISLQGVRMNTFTLPRESNSQLPRSCTMRIPTWIVH